MDFNRNIDDIILLYIYNSYQHYSSVDINAHTHMRIITASTSRGHPGRSHGDAGDATAALGAIHDRRGEAIQGT